LALGIDGVKGSAEAASMVLPKSTPRARAFAPFPSSSDEEDEKPLFGRYIPARSVTIIIPTKLNKKVFVEVSTKTYCESVHATSSNAMYTGLILEQLANSRVDLD
jgi:hypothetical protein